ncbi:hypothetical protein BGX26_012357, partial [Mortierella sp. AD094]
EPFMRSITLPPNITALGAFEPNSYPEDIGLDIVICFLSLFYCIFEGSKVYHDEDDLNRKPKIMFWSITAFIYPTLTIFRYFMSEMSPLIERLSQMGCILLLAVAIGLMMYLCCCTPRYRNPTSFNASLPQMDPEVLRVLAEWRYRAEAYGRQERAHLTGQMNSGLQQTQGYGAASTLRGF